jgi:hypothetical protein
MTIFFLFFLILLMFHKSKTDVERQSLFDAYMLSIFKETEVIKKKRKNH